MKVDMVVDLVYGDCGKGKITKALLESGESYTHVAKSSGGGNAGHSFYHLGKKFVTHYVPAGVFHAITSVIGSGCVIHPKSFLEEVAALEKEGIPAALHLLISENAHIITDQHILEDIATDKIGSTKTGIMPVYRDKYARVGTRAKDCPELKEFLCDQYEILFKPENNILIEGAQGFYLCPDHGDYPFVTSSPPTVSYAFHSLGLPIQSANQIYGICKAYDTYVGTKDFQPEGELFKQIQKAGNEFGATTGRARKVNLLNLPALIRAINVNGVTTLIMNKMDLLRQIKYWGIIMGGSSVLQCDDEDQFIRVIKETIQNNCPSVKTYHFSGSPKTI